MMEAISCYMNVSTSHLCLHEVQGGKDKLNSLLDMIKETTVSQGTRFSLYLLRAGPWHLLLIENDTSVLITLTPLSAPSLRLLKGTSWQIGLIEVPEKSGG